MSHTDLFNSTRYRIAGLVCLAAVLMLLGGTALADDSCDYCGKPIVESYIQFEGHEYHSSCYHRYIAPRCAVCGEEIAQGGVVYDGKQYHRACYENDVALKCSVCGGIIEGEYLVDHWGNKYHKYHQKEIDACSFCGRLFSDPAAGGGAEFGPTHKMCLACSKTGVTNLDEAQKIVGEVLDQLRSSGIDIVAEAFEFTLTDRETLAKMTKRADYDRLGLTRYENTRYWGFLEKTELKLYVLEGLPRYHFIQAAAHELMHAWLFLNARYDADEGDPQMIEGSCNAASMLVLNQLDDEMADYVVAQLEADSDPIYGEGFRRAKHLIDNRGVKYWLDHIRLDPEFPIGY